MQLVERVRRRVSPLREVMSGRDYRAVSRVAPFTSADTHLFGRKIGFSDGAGLLHSVREIFYDEVYRFTARREAPHIIDAGANIGLSVAYFKKLYPNSTVIAYEPDPAIFGLLERNVADYPDVELRQAAAWIEDTELTFFREGSLAGSVEIDYLSKKQPVTVRAERLRDELVKGPVDFLKLDIEGAENEVLFDIEDTLDNVDHLFFEYHATPGKPQRLGTLLDLVARAGFRYVLNGAHGPDHPFVERSGHGFDMQINVSCVRDR